ncbi:hypothetical protein [Pseudanabaena sp. FACHB-2040]|uniref:hypothetical protein n=1 Tax=Pseudanabaena sp. FACHB-2040 TaxID=2692859 RepID=UPI0016829824|nr:hypothetical protein [Pseudanabaena sp. FACHB-2040]MBD2261024.1 hypothetical protein [Pseudanabaena sp. FACHB-2040]
MEETFNESTELTYSSNFIEEDEEVSPSEAINAQTLPLYLVFMRANRTYYSFSLNGENFRQFNGGPLKRTCEYSYPERDRCAIEKKWVYTTQITVDVDYEVRVEVRDDTTGRFFVSTANITARANWPYAWIVYPP